MKKKVVKKKTRSRASHAAPAWTPASMDSTRVLLEEVVKVLDRMRGMLFTVPPDWVKLEVKRNKDGTCDFVYREGGDTRDAALVKNAVEAVKRLFHPKESSSGLVFRLGSMSIKLTTRGNTATIKGRISQDMLIKAIVGEFVSWRHTAFASSAEWRKARGKVPVQGVPPKDSVPMAVPTPPPPTDFGGAFVVNGVDHSGVIKSAITVIENDFLREMSPHDSVKALLDVIPKEILSEFVETVFETEETVIKKVKWISPVTVLQKGEWEWFKQFYEALVKQLEQPKEASAPLYS